MFAYEKRSSAGPMDWTPSDDAAPSRKRPHYDPSASPFITRPSSNRPPVGGMFPPSTSSWSSSSSSTPFLFHHQQPPPSSTQQQHEPFRFDPAAFNPVTAFGLGDIEMSSSEDQTSAPPATTEEPAVAASPQQPRKVAAGAVQREMKRREGVASTRSGRSSTSFRRRRGGGGRRAWGEEEDEGSEDEGESDGERSEAGSESDNSASFHHRRSSHTRRTASHTSTSSRSREGSSALSRLSDHKVHPPQQHHYNLHLPGKTVSHGEIPYILLGYLQFFFNLSLVLILLYLAVQFILTVKADINRKVEEVSYEILQEIAGCTSLYLANQCDPERRVPAMQSACLGWEHCMNRDPTVVGRASVGAETFAGVVNAFVDPISWKTMGFTLTTLTFFTILLNSAFSFYRSSHRPEPLAPAAPAYHPPPPMLGYDHLQQGAWERDDRSVGGSVSGSLGRKGGARLLKEGAEEEGVGAKKASGGWF